jgi:hypothetical protein
MLTESNNRLDVHQPIVAAIEAVAGNARESGQFTLNMAEYAIESVVETVRSATESLPRTRSSRSRLRWRSPCRSALATAAAPGVSAIAHDRRRYALGRPRGATVGWMRRRLSGRFQWQTSDTDSHGPELITGTADRPRQGVGKVRSLPLLGEAIPTHWGLTPWRQAVTVPEIALVVATDGNVAVPMGLMVIRGYVR